MNTIKWSIFGIFAVLITSLFCNKEPTSGDPNIELRSDFSEFEFNQALIGEWESVYDVPSAENVQYLKLTEQGKATLILKKENTETEYKGNYTTDFLRPPTEGMVTFAELTISTSTDTIILSRLNFGYNNAFPIESGLYLRIERSPYGTLKRL